MKSNLNIVNKEILLELEKKCSQLRELLFDLSNICFDGGQEIDIKLFRQSEKGFPLSVSKKEDPDLYMLLNHKIYFKLNQSIREIQNLALTISKENVQ